MRGTDVKFRIIETGIPDQPYGLVDETGTIIRTDYKPELLSNYAFAHTEATEVRHDEDLITAEVIPWKR